MTNEELLNLERLEHNATPGTWMSLWAPDCQYVCQKVGVVSGGNIEDGYLVDSVSEMIVVPGSREQSKAQADHKFIASLRNAAPALIAAARENIRLRAVVEAARAVHRVFFVNTDGELRFVSLESATATVCRLDAALAALDAKGGS